MFLWKNFFVWKNNSFQFDLVTICSILYFTDRKVAVIGWVSSPPTTMWKSFVRGLLSWLSKQIENTNCITNENCINNNTLYHTHHNSFSSHKSINCWNKSDFFKISLCIKHLIFKEFLSDFSEWVMQTTVLRWVLSYVLCQLCSLFLWVRCSIVLLVLCISILFIRCNFMRWNLNVCTVHTHQIWHCCNHGWCRFTNKGRYVWFILIASKVTTKTECNEVQ